MGAHENKSTQETVNGNVDTTPVANYKDAAFKGNEDRKIFVGGIAYDVTNDDLLSYFSKFGDVTQAQVKLDWTTRRSRGFAFVEFATCEACKSALTEREQQIKNKQCEIKPAKSREKKKVFVGGLPADHPEEDLKKHFEQYGKVEDIEWPFDKLTKARRNFAFIVFEEEDAADRAASISKQNFGSRECDVKKAVPQSKRNNNFLQRVGPGTVSGIRNVYGAPGLRGGPALSMHNTTQGSQWFNNGWPQINGVPAAAYAAATGANATTGNWGDWYNNAANFYANGNTTASNFSAYANGYDYNQVAAASGSTGSGIGVTGIRVNRPPQNGTTVATQRY